MKRTHHKRRLWWRTVALASLLWIAGGNFNGFQIIFHLRGDFRTFPFFSSFQGFFSGLIDLAIVTKCWDNVEICLQKAYTGF